MKIDDAIKIATTCAKDYDRELVDKNLLFVYGSEQAAQHIECYFAESNYLHLTGIIYSGTAVDFYRDCIDRKLVASSIKLLHNGLTELKLQILPQIVTIHKKAKTVGNHDGLNSLLYTEKIVGNITACLGFIRKGDIYIPNTALRQDIRDITVDRGRVLAVYRKKRNAAQYTELCYTAKGIDLSSPAIQEVLAGKIAP